MNDSFKIARDFLHKIPILQDLNKEQLGKLREIMKPCSFKSGETIIQDGDIGDTMYILLEGEVEISKAFTLPIKDLNLGVHDKSLIKLSADYHAFFGEIAMFEDKSVRSASVIATMDTKLAEIRREDFMNLVENDYDIGYSVLNRIAVILYSRLEKSNKDILKITTALTLALEEAKKE